MFNRYEYAILTALEQLGGITTTRRLSGRAHSITGLDKKWSSDLFGSVTGRHREGITPAFYKHLNALIAEGVLIRLPRCNIAFAAELEAYGWKKS